MAVWVAGWSLDTAKGPLLSTQQPSAFCVCVCFCAVARLFGLERVFASVGLSLLCIKANPCVVLLLPWDCIFIAGRVPCRYHCGVISTANNGNITSVCTWSKTARSNDRATQDFFLFLYCSPPPSHVVLASVPLMWPHRQTQSQMHSIC